MRPTVYIVDDDDSIRCALTRLLRTQGYETRSYKSATEFLGAPRDSGLGCMILDVCMPGRSGLELQDILSKYYAFPVIFLTGRGDIPMSVRAMKAGAVDFLTKPVEKERLMRAVDTALARDAERQAAEERRFALRDRYKMLSSREREVFAQVAQGKLNKQIAGELRISERTVKAHRAHVMKKMSLRSVADLVRAADELMIGAGEPNSRVEISLDTKVQ
jgi:two-component system, LuxR family, response regulator FixJ